MTFAEIDAYSLSVFLHVSAVVVGFGATFAEAIMFPVAMKAGVRYLPYLHKLQLAINQRLATPALVIVILTGIYQTTERWEWSEGWISATFAIVIVIGGLLGGYFIPADRKLGAMVERELAAADGREVVLSDEYQRGARREGMVGALTGVLLIAAIFLMVTKPF
jgi:ABC-type multidrug transport system permease subunit